MMGIPALSTIECIGHRPCVSLRKGRRGEPVHIDAGQPPEIALLVRGEPPEFDVRCCDGGDHQARHQHEVLYPHYQGRLPVW